jgi:hypothetical protein
MIGASAITASMMAQYNSRPAAWHTRLNR